MGRTMSITIKSYPSGEARDAGTLEDPIGEVIATVADLETFATALRKPYRADGSLGPLAYFDDSGRSLDFDGALTSLGASLKDIFGEWYGRRTTITIKSYPTEGARDAGTLDDTVGTVVAIVTSPIAFASAIRAANAGKRSCAIFNYFDEAGHALCLEEALAALGATFDGDMDEWYWGGELLNF